MHINAEAAGSPAPEIVDRRNAQARHERWALEMDKALFSALPPAAGDPVRQPGQYAWQNASGSPTPLRPHAEGGQARPAGQEQAGIAHQKSQDRDDTVPQDAGMVMGSHAPAQPEPAALEASVSAASAASQPAMVDRTQVSAPVAPVSGPAVPAPAAAAAAIATLAAAGEQGFSQPVQPLAMGARGVSALAGETVPAAQPPVAEPGEASFALPPGRPAGMAGAGMDEGQMDAAPGGRPTASAADEDYAQRVLHMYQQNGDVQAWIRDAQLQPNQASALAQALAMQLSAQGTRLATLTINGREVELPTEDRPQPVNLFDEQLRRVEG